MENKRLIKFGEELKELCKKYQCTVVATLQYDAQGITPMIAAVDLQEKKVGKDEIALKI